MFIYIFGVFFKSKYRLQPITPFVLIVAYPPRMLGSG